MAVEGGAVGMQTTGKNCDPPARVQNHTEEREDEPEEDGEEDSECVDEDCDESGERRLRTGCTTGRVVTLQMLLASDILQPGEATMSIEYLGQRFMGDLLPDGKIKSVETDITFASPSAWAIHCKRIINPEKKSGCGWASVRYKGTKLEIYKTKYFKKRTLDQNKENEITDEEEMELKTAPVQVPSPSPVPRAVIKHTVLGNRSTLHDGNTLVESTPFSSMGKIQPFLISLATNAALVMDFHCHLTTSEVVGYLAGHWDVNAHNLAVTHAFPCRSRLSDKESAPLVEAEICKGLEQRRLTLVGWYHSHPYAPATPTLRDIDSQLDYQIRMKGSSDASYTPCIGIICSPYNKDSISLESVMISYWVMPPPENKPHEYGKPMLMSYTVVQDNYLSYDTLTEMKKCAAFYKIDQDYVNFSEKYKNGLTYLEKLKNTLSSKFPRDQSNGGTLWNYLSELVCPGSTGETQPPPVHHNPPPITAATPLLLPTSLPISIPSANKSTTLLGAELASALFASGKFPSPASLMSLSAIFPSVNHTTSNSPISILKPIISTPSHINASHSHHSYTNSFMNSPSLHLSSLTSHALHLASHNHTSHSHSTQSQGIQLSNHMHSPLSHTTQTHTQTSHSTQSILSMPLAPLSLTQPLSLLTSPAVSQTSLTSSQPVVTKSQCTTTSTTATQPSVSVSTQNGTTSTNCIAPIFSVPPEPPESPANQSPRTRSPQTRPSPSPPPPPEAPSPKIAKVEETKENNIDNDSGSVVTESPTTT